jgi:hypothetical protein
MTIVSRLRLGQQFTDDGYEIDPSPLMDEAADEILRLQKINNIMRDALTEISNHADGWCVAIADDALTEAYSVL